jgi:hypothetical protein
VHASLPPEACAADSLGKEQKSQQLYQCNLMYVGVCRQQLTPSGQQQSELQPSHERDMSVMTLGCPFHGITELWCVVATCGTGALEQAVVLANSTGSCS